MELSKGYRAGIDQMVKQGFSHIKVELEAQLDRDESSCNYCDGDETVTCEECAGDGYFYDDEGARVDCEPCDGTGSVACGQCNGRSGSQDEDWANDYILSCLSPSTRDALVYSQFYNDMSVDSEFTFTLPMVEAHRTVEVIEAFLAMAKQVGNGINTDGAGMHIAVLRGSAYPSGLASHETVALRNFEREVTPLLPALFFLASPDHISRDLYYRTPVISTTKYSAIHVGRGFLEYRVFETCYNRPTAILENIEVIARTLRYYSSDKCAVKVNKTIGFDSNGRTVGRFFQAPAMYDLLQAGLPLLKPADKTIGQLKQERGLKVNIRKLHASEQTERARQRDNYENYLDDIFRRREIEMRRYITALKRDYGLYDDYSMLREVYEAGGEEALYDCLNKDDRTPDFDEWFTSYVTPNSRYQITPVN